MAHIVSVRAEGAAWLVECDSPGFPCSFQSGARAEAAAVFQAEARARGGAPTEVRLFLRDGSLAGRFLVCTPERRMALPS